MVKAFQQYAERIATPDMTAELEADMDKIAAGEVTKDEVVEISRKMLHESYDLMDEHKRELAEIIWEGMNQDRILGPCPKCREAGRKNEEGETNRLRIIRAKKSGKRFVGCEGYPDCDQTYGIPQRGDLIRLEEVCSICGKTPRLKVWTGRRPWNLCLNEECPSMEEMRAQRAEREAARAAKEAAAAAARATVPRTAPRRRTATARNRRRTKRPGPEAPQGAGKGPRRTPSFADRVLVFRRVPDLVYASGRPVDLALVLQLPVIGEVAAASFARPFTSSSFRHSFAPFDCEACTHQFVRVSPHGPAGPAEAPQGALPGRARRGPHHADRPR